MVGTGLIEAEGLEAMAVKCSILGTGDITCWPVKKLDVRGIGTTKIQYKGNPEIKKVEGARFFLLSDSPGLIRTTRKNTEQWRRKAFSNRKWQVR